MATENEGTKRPRRTSGEGSKPRRMPNGRWRAEIMLGYREDGKRDRRTVYGDSKRQVLNRIADLRRQKDGGLLLKPTQATVGALLQEWLRTVVANRRRSSTFLVHERRIRLHLLPALGRVPLVQLGLQDVERFHAGMRQKGLGAQTVRGLHSTLHAALDWAQRRELVARNVAAVVRAPSVPRPHHRVLSNEEGVRLLAAAQATRWEVVLLLAVTLGLRRGELLALRWRDVDWEHEQLSVDRTRIEGRGAQQYAPPKTAAGRRVVPLTPSLLERLRTHRVQQLVEATEHGWRNADDLIFLSQFGRPYHNEGLRKGFKRVLKKAALPADVRFHDLRHTAATLMFASGVPAKSVSAILGHSSIRVTLDLYTESVRELERDAVRRVARALGQG